MKEMMVGSVAPVGPVGRWGAAPPQELLERMKDYGQEGAFAPWDELSPEDRDLLVRDIEVRPTGPQCAAPFGPLPAGFHGRIWLSCAGISVSSRRECRRRVFSA